MNIIPQEEMDSQEAAAIKNYEERQKVLNLGFEKYQKFMNQAIKIARKAKKGAYLEGKEKEEFLKIPLIIRQKAIETVAYENI